MENQINTGASLLVQAMQGSAVKTVFSLSGNQIMPLYDACIDTDVRIVHTRHESSAVFMADAYAQLTGVPGVALVTAAPGFANALGALYSAKMAESPVILLSGDSPVARDGQFAFQEFDQIKAAAAFVKMSVRLQSVDEIESQWQDCVSIALSGTPGPVHIALPADLLLAHHEAAQHASPCPPAPARLTPANAPAPADGQQATAEVGLSGPASVTELRSLAAKLATASTPIVFVSPQLNATRQPDLHLALSQVLQVPVVAMESPRGLNDPALGSIKSLCKDTDLVVLLGKLPDFSLGFVSKDAFPRASLVLVQSEPSLLKQCDWNESLTGATRICAEPLSVINQLLNQQSDSDKQPSSQLPSESRQEWLAKMQAGIKLQPPVTHAAGNEALHTSELVHCVAEMVAACKTSKQSETVKEDTIVVCDGGEFGQWAQAFVKSPLRVINGLSGAIGGSIPYATGAGIAKPDAVVVALLGDGTAGFYLAELETLAREAIAAIIIVGNDSCWNAEYQIQKRDYGQERTYACELPAGLRYDQVATALGLHGAKVSALSQLQSELEEAFKRARQHRQGTLINAFMQRIPAPTFNDGVNQG